MGNTKLRHILPTTNTPPPSRSGMQRTSNRVATITSQSTTDDLQQKREKTRDKCSAWSSSKCTNQYKHGCEVQLNIPEKQLRLWTECKSSSGTAIEWQTDKHEILGFHMEKQAMQTRLITSQSRSKCVVHRPSRMYSHDSCGRSNVRI